MAIHYRSSERIVRGFSNHRRIRMLETLEATPMLDLMTLARACGVNVKTASEHTRRLVAAGLVTKHQQARRVMHAISPRGTQALNFVREIR